MRVIEDDETFGSNKPLDSNVRAQERKESVRQRYDRKNKDKE